MATVSNNIILKGFRGRLGDMLVFKTMRGKTHVSMPARKPDKKKESAAQRNTRVTFRQATEWAHRILLDPEQKAYYQKRAKAMKLPNAYTAAITDYMRKPNISKTQHGETITYRIAKRDFKLKGVNAFETGTQTKSPPIHIRQHHDTWWVDYSPDRIHTAALTLTITDYTLREMRYSVRDD